jgi:hypothetical protein
MELVLQLQFPSRGALVGKYSRSTCPLQWLKHMKLSKAGTVDGLGRL